MHLPRKAFYACCAVLALSVPAMAGVTINTPGNNTNVPSPFTLSASAATCSSQGVSSMGYSFDSSSDTTVVNQQSMDIQVASSTGTHTLHVKAWGSGGSSCVTDVVVNVQSGAEGASAVVPDDALTVSDIQALGGWQKEHDSGGSGSSSGSTSIVSSPSLYGSTRAFQTTFSNSGDERYSADFADDVNAENFFYDGWVYLTDSASEIGNLEMDVNQVMANGKTLLVGVQCDGYRGTWDYTVNTGSASDVKPQWVSKSGTRCNPRNWTRHAWHHVQYCYSRDDSVTIAYKSIWLDGTEVSINKTAFG
ncbi:MAG: hypothetical protein ABR928_18210, partial [Terracidiphilus sp.]